MNSSNDTFFNKTLELLSKELDEKNRQIEYLLQRQYESNLIYEFNIEKSVRKNNNEYVQHQIKRLKMLLFHLREK